MPGSTVLTIGNFDGVHRGHARLLRCARDLADQRASRLRALVFDPHPAFVLRPGTAPPPPRLSSFGQRERWLKELGVDSVIRLDPSSGVLSLSPVEFVEQLRHEHGAGVIVEGPDFCFGKGRSGTIQTLRELCTPRSIDVRVIEPVSVALSDHHVVPARSTMARWLIERGRITDASAVLGRWYEIEGTVVPGDRRGRTIGFPTANIRTEHFAPANGVYACIATLPDGRSHVAATSIGTKPTFAGTQATIETHLLLDGPTSPLEWRPLPAMPEYGWPIRLAFVAWVREQIRFESVLHLTGQLARDISRVRSLVHASTCSSDIAKGNSESQLVPHRTPQPHTERAS